MAKKDLKFSIGFRELLDPKEYFDDLKHPIGRAVTAAMRDVSDTAKDVIREDVVRNFKNRMRGNSNFKNSFRAYDFPDRKTGKFSYSPAATIQANPSWAHIFEDGGRIEPARAGFLAIPTEEAEKRGLHEIGSGRAHARRVSQTDKARRLFGDLFVVEDDDETYLAAKIEDETVFLFNLRRWTREKKKVSIERRSKEAFRLLPAKFKAHFPKT